MRQWREQHHRADPLPKGDQATHYPRMDTEDIEARIGSILSNVELDLTNDLLALRTELSMTGNHGGTVALKKGMNAFRRRLHEHVQTALDELAKNIETRGKQWKQAHNILEFRTVTDFQRVKEDVRQAMFSGPAADAFRICELEYNAAISHAKEMIVLHREGWHGPRREKWTARHPVLFGFACAALGYLANLFEDDARALIDRGLGIEAVKQAAPPE